jgi:hypothetical protein
LMLQTMFFNVAEVKSRCWRRCFLDVADVQTPQSGPPGASISSTQELLSLVWNIRCAPIFPFYQIRHLCWVRFIETGARGKLDLYWLICHAYRGFIFIGQSFPLYL